MTKRPRLPLRWQLEEQQRHNDISNLSRNELIELFLPHSFWEHISFWTFIHIPWLHKYLGWIICQIKPFDIETHTRHWWFEKVEDWREYR